MIYLLFVNLAACFFIFHILPYMVSVFVEEMVK